MKDIISLHNRMWRRMFLAGLVLMLSPLAASAQYSVEYFWDKDPGVGKGTTLTTSSQDTFKDSLGLSVTGLSAGVHQLGLRVLNKRADSLLWSETHYRKFYVAPAPHEVQALEYFWDTDPGVGNGTLMSATTNGTDSVRMSFDLYTEDLQEGVHKLGMRVLTDGTWSETQTRKFFIRNVYDDQIGRIEYYWDTDPGKGNGKSLAITPAGEIDLSTYINVMYLSGKHTMYLRAQSGTGNWSDDYKAGEVEVVGDFSDKHYNDTYTLIDKQTSYQNSDEAAIYNKVEYKRTFSNTNWQSLYVPFSMTYDEWMGDFEVARLSNVHQYDDDSDGKVDRTELEAIKMKEGTTVQPNTPYLIKARTIGEKTITATADPALYLAEQNSFDCSSMDARYVFTGNYGTISGTAMKTSGYYAMASGKLSKAATAEASLAPFRWYLSIESRGSAKVVPEVVNVKIAGDIFEDEATGIRLVERGECEMENGSPVTITGYYDINGSALSALQRGINIVRFSNGTARKIIIR